MCLLCAQAGGLSATDLLASGAIGNSALPTDRPALVRQFVKCCAVPAPHITATAHTAEALSVSFLFGQIFVVSCMTANSEVASFTFPLAT